MAEIPASPSRSSTWRDGLLKEFQPRFSRLTLVADPDGLLTEEGMLSAIRSRGFDLIPFDDSIAFRFAYESQYRSLWDRGETTDLVVVLRSQEQELKSLPFDLLKAGRQLSFALHQLFPKLNYPVLAKLDRSHLDAVHDAYPEHGNGQYTERETKDFVLLHCFGLVPTLLKSPVALLKSLLSLHVQRTRLPEFLADYLVEHLAKEPALAGWPLADLVGDPDKLLHFLQVEWERFVAAGAKVSPTCRVPFAHDDVRAYVDTLFFDGALTAVVHPDGDSLPTWVQAGLVHDPKGDALRRYHGLKDDLRANLPPPHAPHQLWQRVAERWAELVVLRWECDGQLDAAGRAEWATLHLQVEDTFAAWMLARYGLLYNLPHLQAPVMLHHVPHFLAAEKSRRKLAKVALVVLDGLALDQWVLLRRELRAFDPDWRFQESTAFAWVPTLTSVSRQSIFAGNPPFYFPESLAHTSKERSHWLKFWKEKGVAKGAAELVTNLSGVSDPDLDRALANPHLAVLGIVWNKVDNIMHGMAMQTPGMHNHVALWGAQRHLHELLTRLHEEGFTTYLTADHGNVTAEGVGTPKEGVLVETRGSRARIYDHPDFRAEVASRFPDAVLWPPVGLPPNTHALLGGRLTAFAGDGTVLVSHGGIALEEVIVPFVAVSREETK